MDIVLTLVGVIFFFGLAVFIHELGHFLAARACGMAVDAFSIGFGPAIWKHSVNGVVYKIGIFPLGGYVALPQMDPSGHALQGKDGQPRELPEVSPGRRIIVGFAGVVGNVLLAWLMAVIIWLVGRPAQPHEANTIVGYVASNSVAKAQGLRIGDEILRVHGRPVANWTDILIALSLAPSTDAVMTVRTGDATNTVTVPTERMALGGRALAGVEWMDYAVVMSVRADSGAEKAGLKAGDRIIAIAGQPVYSRGQISEVIASRPDQDIPITVRRRGVEQATTVRPSFDEKLGRPMIGIAYQMQAVDLDTIVHPSPGSQLQTEATQILRFLRALVTPKQARQAADSIGGPVMIFTGLWIQLQLGFIMAISFSVMLNVNLAILNLLPLPVLDGGHILVCLWEAITRRKPSASVVTWLWNTSAVLLIGLFVLLTVRDVRRLGDVFFPSRAPPAAATNAPPAATNAPVAPPVAP